LLLPLVDRFEAFGGETVHALITNQNDGDPLALLPFLIAPTALRLFHIILLERNIFLNKKSLRPCTDAAPLGAVQDDLVGVAAVGPVPKRTDLRAVAGIDAELDLVGL
jgi:hypothetical protein